MNIPYWLCLLPFALAYAIALPVLFLAGRDAWREMTQRYRRNDGGGE